MTDPNAPHQAEQKNTTGLLSDARRELAGMISDGFDHPSTKPVLVWGALGAAGAAVLPFVGVPLGFAAGAGYKLYKRLRPT